MPTTTDSSGPKLQLLAILDFLPPCLLSLCSNAPQWRPWCTDRRRSNAWRSSMPGGNSRWHTQSPEKEMQRKFKEFLSPLYSYAYGYLVLLASTAVDETWMNSALLLIHSHDHDTATFTASCCRREREEGERDTFWQVVLPCAKCKPVLVTTKNKDLWKVARHWGRIWGNELLLSRRQED